MSGVRAPALLALVVGFAVVPPAYAGAGAVVDSVGVPGAIRTTVLPNGLTVVMVSDSAAAAVDLSIWYDAGLRSETPGHSGIAHLFEHLMFDGSTHVPRRAHTARIDSLGGSSGAITTADGMCVFETVPTNGLEEALTLEADRMTGLVIDTARLDAERAMVPAERLQPALNSPVMVGMRLAAETAFGTHPYHSPVMGSDADLAHLTLKDAQAWYHAHYGPAHAVLTLVGRFDPDAALEIVQREFGPLRGGDATTTAPALPAANGERRRWVRTVLPYPLLVMGWNVPGRHDPDFAPLSMLATVLAHGEGSRLSHELITNDRWCFFIDGDVDARRDASLFTLVAGVQPGADSAAVERTLVAAVQHVAEAAPSEDELERARRPLESAMLFSWQSTRGRGQAVGSAVATGATPAEPARELMRLRACTAADVQRAAAKWLTTGRRTVVWLGATIDDTKEGR